MKKGIVAFVLLIVVGVALYFGLQAKRRLGKGAADGVPGSGTRVPEATVVFKAGGEKSGFLRDPDLLDYLQRHHHLVLKPEKEGSVEMVRQPIAGLDGLWPASEYCRQEFENRAQREAIRFNSQDIFNSPLVVASGGRGVPSTGAGTGPDAGRHLLRARYGQGHQADGQGCLLEGRRAASARARDLQVDGPDQEQQRSH